MDDDPPRNAHSCWRNIHFAPNLHDTQGPAQKVILGCIFSIVEVLFTMHFLEKMTRNRGHFLVTTPRENASCIQDMTDEPEYMQTFSSFLVASALILAYYSVILILQMYDDSEQKTTRSSGYLVMWVSSVVCYMTCTMVLVVIETCFLDDEESHNNVEAWFQLLSKLFYVYFIVEAMTQHHQLATQETDDEESNAGYGSYAPSGLDRNFRDTYFEMVARLSNRHDENGGVGDEDTPMVPPPYTTGTPPPPYGTFHHDNELEHQQQEELQQQQQQQQPHQQPERDLRIEAQHPLQPQHDSDKCEN